MSIYSDQEISTQNGFPVECYLFVGSFKTYAYTSADSQQTVNGIVFEPIAPIKRGELNVGTSEDDNIVLKISLPVTTDIARDYAFQITPPSLYCTVYRAHRNTDMSINWAIPWQGPVDNFSVAKDECAIMIPSVFANALEGSVPSYFFQTPCNHVLYDTGCKVSRAANTLVTTVTAVNGAFVELASDGGFPNGHFVGGECADVSRNDRRTIISHAANAITVNYPFFGLQVGMEVEVVAGCDHAFDGHCKTKYDNRINFGGTPFIPLHNPFSDGV